jgi:lysophospholipase L1-like esterase
MTRVGKAASVPSTNGPRERPWPQRPIGTESWWEVRTGRELEPTGWLRYNALMTVRRAVTLLLAAVALTTAPAQAASLGGTAVMRRLAHAGALHGAAFSVTRARYKLLRAAMPPASRAFRYFGGAIRRFRRLGGAYGPSRLDVTPAWTVRFLTRARSFDVLVSGGGGAQLRISVDGATGAIMRLRRWGPHRVKVRLRRPARLVISVDLDQQERFLGVVSPRPVRRTGLRVGPRTVIVGDSYTAGTGADARFTGLAQRFAGRIGLGDLWASAAPGTGYLASLPRAPSFARRLTATVLRWHPRTVIFAGGLNDAFFSHATGPAERAAALDVFQRTRAALPQARVIAVGPWTPNGIVGPELAAVRDAIHAAASDAGVPFIDTIGWITPDNRARYVNASAHPTQAGHDYLGERLAAAIKRLP